MTAVENAALEQPKPSRVWMWVLGVIALGLLGNAVTFQAQGVNSFAYSTGFWVVPVALGAALFCAIFKSSREFWYHVFAVMYGSAVVGAWIGTTIQQQEAAKAMSGMRESLTTFANQMSGDLNAPAQRVDLQPVTTSASGDMGVMEIVTKQLMNDAAAAQNAYLQALEQARWSMLLDVERLRKDTTMTESREIIEATTKVVKEHRAKSLAIFDTLPERVKNAPFKSEAARRQFMAGAEQGMINGRRNGTKTWDYEEAIIREYAAVIDVLTQAGRYEFDKDNNVLFDNDASIEAYNQHMTTAQRLTEEQAAHIKSAQAAAFKKFDAAMPK